MTPSPRSRAMTASFFEAMTALALLFAPFAPVLALLLVLQGASAMIALAPILLAVAAVVVLGIRRASAVREGRAASSRDAAPTMAGVAQAVLVFVMIGCGLELLLLWLRFRDADPLMVSLAVALVVATLVFAAVVQLRLLKARQMR